jgi:tetratricopeptide (TPR) repeat protein
MAGPTTPNAREAFRAACTLAAQGLFADAALAFRRVAERWPDDDLADDALYDAGACYLSLNQFARAKEAFQQVVARYPEARMDEESTGGRETGRTAARAHLGLVSACLGLGDPAGARAAAEALAAYGDSKLRPAAGIERTYRDVATSLLQAASPEAADVIGPSDVVAGEDASA